MVVKDEALAGSYFHNPFSFIRSLRITPSPSVSEKNQELEAAQLLNQTLLQQNQQNNQLIQEIWLELQKKKAKKKHNRRSHGALCKCQKCCYRRARKGKQILGKSRIVQTDGNDTDGGTSTQPESSNQPKTFITPNALKQALKRTKDQRPAKASAKILLDQQRQWIGDGNNSDKDPDYQTTDESSDYSDDEENDSKLQSSSESEDFHSLPSGSSEKITEPQAETSQQGMSAFSQPAHQSPCRVTSKKPHVKTPKIDPVKNLDTDIPEEEKCFIQYFDLEINATKIDQLSHPGTFKQAPTDYYRFLSKYFANQNI